jgi:ADP-heptose:LPS heptosyltransferase
MNVCARAARRLKPYTALAKNLAANLARLQKIARLAAADQKSVTAIILTGRLGDLVAAQSVLPLLAGPDKTLIWLVEPRYADILLHNPALAAVIHVTATTEALLLRRLVPGITWRNLHIDKTYCQTFNFLLRNPNPHHIVFDNFYDFGPLADIYTRLATDRLSAPRPIIHLSPHARPNALRRRLFAAPENPLLVCHPVSDEPDRTWPQPHAAALANWVLQNTNFNIFEPGLTPCLPASGRIAAPGAALPLGGQVALTHGARIFIGVDSAFAHLANAFAIPSILLLGPYRHFTTHLPWRLHPNDTLLRAATDLAAISPQDVITALKTHHQMHQNRAVFNQNNTGAV